MERNYIIINSNAQKNPKDHAGHQYQNFDLLLRQKFGQDAGIAKNGGIMNIEKQLRKLRADYERKSKEKTRVEMEIEHIKQKLKDLGVNTKKEVKQKIDRLQKEIDEAKDEIEKALEEIEEEYGL